MFRKILLIVSLILSAGEEKELILMIRTFLVFF